MEQSLMVRMLRLVSVTEATSYLALLVATAVKETGGSEIGVTVLGPIHGVLYLVFVGLVLGARNELEWSLVRTVLALIIGSLPFGGFWIDRNWLAPHGRTGPVGPEPAPVG
ncbi:MAG: DUF3817 domain-containing protein [Actinomycetota bacterium]